MFLRPLVYFLLFPFIHGILWAQNTKKRASYSHQLAFRHDNDFIFNTDHYYSSGLYIHYRAGLQKRLNGDQQQWGIRLGQEVHTPAQTRSTNTNFFDRPYAGFTGLLTEWSTANERRLIQIGLLLGLVGNNSGAGGLQRWFHRVISITETPMWTAELDNRTHLNLYLDYAKEWDLSTKPFGIKFALQPQLALGTRDAFITIKNTLYFGKRNATTKSIAYHRLGTASKELYFSLSSALKQVWHNALIEGHLLRDLSAVVRPTTKTVVLLGTDLNHRNKNQDYKIGIRFTTKESPNATSHTYLKLSYAINW